MAWTQADLDAVKAALAKGEQTVAFADRSVTYRSTADLLRIKDEIERELAVTAKRPTQYRGYTKKGF